MRLLAFAIVLMVPLWAVAAWPQLPLPANARMEPVGTQVRLNGIPMRIQRVLVRQEPEVLIRHYRDVLGPRHAVERLQDRLILSQGRDDYFVTISIRALRSGETEALVSVADVRAARQAAGRPLGVRLPADSAVLSDMESVDAGKRSRQLVLSNAHAIPANLDALSRELAARGMQPDGPPLRQRASEHVQFFKGDKREAQLTLVRRAGETGIVLTMVEAP